MLKATFKTIRQTTLKTVVLPLIAQAQQKVEMEVALLKEFVNQLSCLLLLAQALLMRKLKVVHQIILATKNTLKKLVCVPMGQLKQTDGNFIQILVLQIHHHVK